MSFWDRLWRKSASINTSLDLFREVYGASSTTWAGKSINTTEALQVSAALACGRVISEGIAMLPAKVMLARNGQVNPAPAHPLYDKLASSPNPLQTAFEFMETLAWHLAFTGNAYCLVNRVAKRIDELWPLQPAWLTVKYRFTGEPTYEVRVPDGQTFTLSGDDIWHIKGPSWTSFYGMDCIKLARQALGLSLAVEEGQAKLQSQGARTSGVLAVKDTLTEEQYKKLRAWLEKDYEGQANSGKTMVIDNAATYTSTALTNVDAQTLETRKFQIEEICRFFRVMPLMVGYSDKTATYASAEQMFLAHMVHTIGPWLRRIEQSIDKHLLSDKDRAAGYYVKINEKAAMRMTAVDQANMLKGLVLTGILSQNEAREVLDKNPKTGAESGHDALLTPVNVVAGDPPTKDDLNSAPVDPNKDEKP